MGVGAGFCMYDVVVKKFTFTISSPDEFLFYFFLPTDTTAMYMCLVPCHTCDFLARLWRATLSRDKEVARCDFDAASSESLEAMFVARCIKVAASHAATLSRVRVARQSRATKSQLWHGTYDMSMAVPIKSCRLAFRELWRLGLVVACWSRSSKLFCTVPS